MFDIAVHILAFLLGAILVVSTLLAAVQTFVLPRSARVFLAAIVFRTVDMLFFRWRVNRAKTFEQQDKIMALYAPIALLCVPAVWIAFIILGYMPMFWAVGVTPWREALITSGSSLLTLGFARPEGPAAIVLVFSEATIGLGFVALLIAYLPTMYGAFSKREAAVTMLDTYAGTPPSAVVLLQRAYRIRGIDTLGQLWDDWTHLFGEIEESHSSLAVLVFFRSPRPERSWITAAGAVMDACALLNSAVEAPFDARAALCIRSGYLSLRHIADFFQVKHNNDPNFPQDPICISREEFDEAYDELADSGVPMKPNRDQAWQDFAGWRVNYDAVLLALARLVRAPYAQWSSDRALLDT